MQEEKSITSAGDIEENIGEDNTGEKVPKGKIIKKSGKRIGFNYIIYKSIKESQKNDVMKCIYIKGLFDFGICVIKEGTLGDSKDKQGRDIKDRLIWQKDLHELLQDKIRVPRYLGSFEENGNYYLIIEHLRGKSLIQILRNHNKELRRSLNDRNNLGKKLLSYLLKIIDLLDVLHQNQIVHRDASSNNFMVIPGGEIALIDLELSYSLNQKHPSPPFQLGTQGFMSPQQLATMPPTVEEDIFALGAIIFQMWTYISPFKIAGSPHTEITKKINFFIRDKKIADIISSCLHPEANQRPTLDAIRNVIKEYKTTPRAITAREFTRPPLYTKQEIQKLIQDSIETFSTPLLADPDKGWFSENIKESRSADNGKINKSWYASFNKGVAGVIYMLSSARLAGMNIERCTPFVQKGLDLIEKKYIERIASSSPGLHFGASGIAATIAYSINSQLINYDSQYIKWIHILLDKENKRRDILNGVSGQGFAQMICSRFIKDELLSSWLNNSVDLLVSTQKKDGYWVSSTDTNKKLTKGFLLGMSGIICFLLEYAQQFNNNDAIMAAERGLHWLIKKAKRREKSIYWLSDSGKALNHWLSVGTTGIALAFIKGYEVINDPQYKEFASGALYNHKAGDISNMLSQGNGLSGLGEVYLEAIKVFNDSIWQEQVDNIVQNILHLQKRHPIHGTYWLAEHEQVPTSSFMTGNSGILHFLIRYCYPDKIRFPMFTNGSFRTEMGNLSLTNCIHTL